MLKLRGVYCPLATAFDHAGELYPTKIRHNVSRLNRTRIAGLEAGGAVGEGLSMTTAERRLVFGWVAEAAEDKTLLAAVDSESLTEALELSAAAADLGYDAVTAAAPRAYGGSDPALFFHILADRAKLPVLAVVRDEKLKLGDFATHPNIAGLIDYSAEGGTARAALDLGREDFQVVIANQAAVPALWEAGARAILAPLANAVPFHLLSLEEALRTRELDAARELAHRADPAHRTVWLEGGAAGLKAAMDLRGGYGGAPRPPLTALSPEQRDAVRASIEGLAS